MDRRTDEYEKPVLDVGQQPVLLGLIEAVYLVDEEERPAPFAVAPVPRALDDLLELG